MTLREESTAGPKRLKRLLSGFKVYFSKAVATVLFYGFASGLPRELISGTWRIWLKARGVDTVV
jgi:hypothetical protein